ncbi:type II secretion system protein [Chitinimonas naiadis]
MRASRGFTLIEMTMVLTIVAVIAATVSVFLAGPIRSYLLNRQRAELTTAGDAIMRRLSRDLRLALPNSIRLTTSGTITYVEFLQTRTGGRYRDQTSDAGAGDPLSFSGDTSFDTLGSLPASGNNAVQVNTDQLVIYNLGLGTANAYTGQNRSTIRTVTAGSLAGESHLTFDNQTFPLASPGNRFHVVSGVQSYVCAPGAVDAAGDGSGTLTLWRSYAIVATQPTAAPSGAKVALMSRYISACSISYDPDPLAALQRSGLINIRLTLARGGDTVSLFNSVHISNVP